jgi:hypothetical protein
MDGSELQSLVHVDAAHFALEDFKAGVARSVRLGELLRQYRELAGAVPDGFNPGDVAARLAIADAFAGHGAFTAERWGRLYADRLEALAVWPGAVRGDAAARAKLRDLPEGVTALAFFTVRQPQK